jgi:DNA polymerase-3 subunit alpha
MGMMRHAHFVHLHLHSQYSLLDGAIRFDQVLEEAMELRMPALAITDHGNLFGAIEFYEKARKKGIKPIIGCEVYVAPRSRFDKSSREEAEMAFHLILLCRNLKGYKNLLKLTSAGYLEGFYYNPRIDKDLLKEHKEGLIGLSACLKGEIPYLLQIGREDMAREVASFYRDIFGPDGFYLEVMDNKIPVQRRVNEALIRLSKELSIPLVATNDCHYLKREEARAHDVLLCIQTGKVLSDENRLKFSTDEFYFKSPEEMEEAFRDIPEAIRNTIEIAQKCNLELELDTPHLPRFPLDKGEDVEKRLNEMAVKGLEMRLKNLGIRDESMEATYRERLNRELDIINSMGFAGYFLIVADFINFAKAKGIPVGPGRGSAAGSLVAYCLNITDIDPIKYNLIFERFLNPERRSLPDIDIDFCMFGREEVIKYVTEKYGSQNVAQIITFGKMQARAVIRDVGRVMNMPYGEVDKIAKLIPQIQNITLEEAIREEPRLKELLESDQKVKELIDIARSLEGLARHASTHAAGIVISDKPIVEYLPLYRGQKGEIVTQYDMKSVEKIGLIKFDFLGLRTLTVIDYTIKLLKSRGIDIDISQISQNLDDEEVYRLLCSGNTAGIFQLEGSGMRELLVKMKPGRFEDIIALVALYRPGPLGSNMIDDFIDRKQGKVQIKYEIPELEPILKDTYGVIVYQEQVMQIASALASYSPGEADILRKAMGKKILRVMEEQKQRFIEGAIKNGIDVKKAEKIFDLMAKFGEYGFNKSHSAAYAMVAYQTAYLKAHYPVEFMAALLTSEKDHTDKVVKYIGECKEMGIEILPPDINESERDFSVSEGRIRFGLAGVKNVGSSAIDAILSVRKEKGPFASLYDFCERVDLHKVTRRVIESLIKCGAFDFTGAHRAQMMAGLDRAIEHGMRIQKEIQNGQINMFMSLGHKKRIAHKKEPLPNVEPWSQRERLNFEKESLGFYVTGHPLEDYMEVIKRWANADTQDISMKKDGSSVTFGGIINSLREIKTKKGDRMAFLSVEDQKGFVDCIVFSDLYKQYELLIKGDEPLLFSGTVDQTEENTKVILTGLELLSEVAKRKAPSFHLRIFAQGLNEEFIGRIREIIESNPGPCDVNLHIIFQGKGEVVISTGDDLRISIDERLINTIHELFGPLFAGAYIE